MSKSTVCQKLSETQQATGKLILVSGQERNHGQRRKEHGQRAIFTTTSKGADGTAFDWHAIQQLGLGEPCLQLQGDYTWDCPT